MFKVKGFGCTTNKEGKLIYAMNYPIHEYEEVRTAKLNILQLALCDGRMFGLEFLKHDEVIGSHYAVKWRFEIDGDTYTKVLYIV